MQKAALKSIIVGKATGGLDRRRKTKANEKAERAGEVAVAKVASDAEEEEMKEPAMDDAATAEASDGPDLLVSNRMELKVSKKHGQFKKDFDLTYLKSLLNNPA